MFGLFSSLNYDYDLCHLTPLASAISLHNGKYLFGSVPTRVLHLHISPYSDNSFLLNIAK